MTIKVKMHPHPLGVKGTSGIDQVVLAYGKHLPNFGVEIVHPDDEHFDLVAGHVGTGATLEHPFVCHVHGLHWTADYPCETWQYYVNAKVIDAVRKASAVTVPSQWVAESFQRDMRFTPHIIPHGIDADAWKYDGEHGGYVLWNKNRAHDVCDATSVVALAQRFPRQHFVTTFMPRGSQGMSNVNPIGAIPHDQMKQLVQNAMVYLSTVKETWGIGALEAMAAGVPVLGFDYGGNSLLVEHGRNGYLAKPGDFDDLAEGLKYCAKYRDALGANGREMARAWTWESAVEMVAGVYRRVLQPEPATVAVVIPYYNIGVEKLERAIESVRNQGLDRASLHSIVVVDDGSTDGTDVGAMVQRYAERDDKIRLIQKNNEGVAIARNTGIASTRAKYIACLDADDAMHPEFIERCVRELEADRSLGIAYTGLWYIKPDGQEGLSKWPGDWNFDAHLQKQNQIPTCCVFRREAWERVGGYKPRYCPDGAGEEDAEFWLRLGAYGYKAKKVDKRGLFIYSWQSGQVSGNSNHQATDWTAWHPWAGEGADKYHPFASHATPQNHSHEVRQCDEPTISVVIPVGPGHEDKVVNALDSLEAQTFRGWEVIVVWDGPGFAENSTVQSVQKAYPYARFLAASAFDDTPPHGAGWARNLGASVTRAPLLVFLDADDWLYPTALEKMLHAWNEHQAIIYTDYTSKAIVKTEYMREIESKNRLHAVLKSYDADGETWHDIVYKSEAFSYDCERAQRQPEQDERGNYYIWCNVTVLIPKAWHDEIGGFDELLESWEDVEYHWRLAKTAKCYHRIQEELLVYNFHMGNRREKGRQNHKNLLYYISEKHKEIDITMCGPGCSRGGRRAVRQTSSVFAADKSNVLSKVDDDSFVLCWYTHLNTGNHQVTGAAILDKKIDGFRMIPKRDRPMGWSIDYGYRSGGRKEKFLVHKADVAAQPNLFQPIEDRQAVAVPEVEKAPLPAPSNSKSARKPSQDVVSDVASGVESAQPRTVIDMGDQSLPPEITARPIDVEQVIASQADVVVDADPMFELQMIPGINKAIARRFVDAGYTTRAKIATLDVDELMKVKGVGETKARMILEHAARERVSG